jgi:hypothetical protein
MEIGMNLGMEVGNCVKGRGNWRRREDLVVLERYERGVKSDVELFRKRHSKGVIGAVRVVWRVRVREEPGLLLSAVSMDIWGGACAVETTGRGSLPYLFTEEKLRAT